MAKMNWSPINILALVQVLIELLKILGVIEDGDPPPEKSK